jgi:hypothetical protein
MISAVERGGKSVLVEAESWTVDAREVAREAAEAVEKAETDVDASAKSARGVNFIMSRLVRRESGGTEQRARREVRTRKDTCCFSE